MLWVSEESGGLKNLDIWECLASKEAVRVMGLPKGIPVSGIIRILIFVHGQSPT